MDQKDLVVNVEKRDQWLVCMLTVHTYIQLSIIFYYYSHSMCCVSLQLYISALQGEKGFQGPAGIHGREGMPGTAGPQGDEGKSGKDGQKGKEGKSGMPGELGFPGDLVGH